MLKLANQSLFLIGFTCLFTACGGGDDNEDVTTLPPAATPKPAVSTINASEALKYGQAITFKITGTDLNDNYTVTSSQCDNFSVIASQSKTEQAFTCTPIKTGTMSMTLTMENLGSDYASSLEVPKPQVIIFTSMGDITVELEPNNAAITVDNFLQYVAENFYNNLIFHRVIGNFMIQGGGFYSNMSQKNTRDPIKLESVNGLHNTIGSIAMARTGVADSATSQFYINVVDNSNSLDGTTAGVDGYAVFGNVTAGLDVVNTIKAVATSTQGNNQNVPVSAIYINRIVRIQ